MRFLPLLLRILPALFLGSSFAYSQGSPMGEEGSKPYGSYTVGDIDQVNMMSGSLDAHIPIYSLPQRGQLALGFSLLWNDNGHLAYYGSCSQGTTNCSYAYMARSPGVKVVWDQSTTFTSTRIFTPITNSSITNLVGAVTLADGTTHNLGNDQADSSYKTLRATDGSGYKVVLPYSFWDNSPNPQQGTVISSTGVQYQPVWQTISSSPHLMGMNVVDPDGNELNSVNSSGVESSSPQLTDTVGRVIPDIAGLINYALVRSSIPSSVAGCPVLTATNQPLVGSISWTPPGYTTPYLFCFATISVRTNYFGLANGQTSACSGSGSSTNYPCYREAVSSLPGLQSVVLPNKTYWAFTYDSADPTSPATSIGYGDLTSIVTPTGGTISYTHGIGPTPCANSTFPGYTRAVGSRSVNAGDGNMYTSKYRYGALTTSGGIASMSNTITQADGNDVKYTYTGNQVGGFECASYESSRTTYQGSASANLPLQTIATTYYSTPDPQGLGLYGSGQIGVMPHIVTRTLYQSGTNSAADVSTETYTYDAGFTDVEPGCNGASCGTYTPGSDPTQVVPFGKRVATATSTWNASSSLRSTSTAYLWQSSAAYKNANLLDLPSSTTITGPGTSGYSATYTYDEPSYLNASTIGSTQQHIASPNGSTRGHLTTATVQVPSASNVTTHTAWWDTGEIYKSVDGRGAATTYVYSNDYAGAYCTTTTNDLNQSISRSYSLNTGTLSTSTDSNNNLTTYHYDDMRRVTDLQFPDVQNSVHGETKLTYHDQAPFSVTSQRTMNSSAVLVPDEEWDVDGLGREAHHKLLSDPAGTDTTDITYDAMGRQKSVSTPYRSTSDTTYDLTLYSYDALGRPTTATHAGDGTTIRSSYSGNSVDTYDEASHDTRRISDSLGRLIEVLEPDSSNNPSLETDYTYDALGNLLSATQKGASGETARARSFSYDSLSRLISASSPEFGATCYGQIVSGICQEGYDANNNLLYKTDARGAVTSFTYDALNRVISKSYGSTVVASYFYDGQVGQWAGPSLLGGNLIGRLSFVRSFNPELTGGTCNPTTQKCDDQYFGYDNMGRTNHWVGAPPSEWGLTDHVISRTYDLSGHPLLTTYPDGRQVSFAYDGAGRLQSAIDQTQSATLISNIAYYPSGAVSQIIYGNSLSQTTSLNKRLQPCEDVVAVGGTRYIDRVLHYSSGSNGATPCAPESGDNGNIWHINDGISTYTQHMSYDSLNRLASWTAPSMAGQASQIAFGYDSFGNMTQVSGATPLSPSYDFNSANHYTHGSTYLPGSFSCLGPAPASQPGYDAAGNMVCWGSPAGDGQQYVWDTESRIADYGVNGAGGVSGAILRGRYSYDALGQRVRADQFMSSNVALATTGVSATFREYSTFDGQVLGEKDQTGAWTDYVFANGQRVARVEPGNNYVYSVADQVHTVSMDFNANGTLRWQGQFLPFGGEVDQGPGLSRYKFTGKERDAESGLDFFGARYYGSSMGRMMSPDPLMASAKVWDPQTWNRYAYARNNPLRYIDPTGLAEVNAADCAKDKACVTVNVNVIYDKNANGGKGVSDSQKAGFEKNQLQNAKDQYGNADIHLNVSYTAGEINSKGNLTGVEKGSLNVFVTDSGGPVSASSGGYALSRINISSSNKDDLSHEMAHHFMGDMSSALGRTLSQDPTGISRLMDNLFTDITNDTGRAVMNNVTPRLPNYPGGAPMSVFNPQAKEFQNRITPQTHP